MTLLEAIAGDARSGVLYGIGVGPGDVRYLTLRAAGLVRGVDVLAYFAKRGSQSNARRIVEPLIGSGRSELRLEYPITEEIPVTHPDYTEQISGFYQDAAADIAARLGEGRSVGLLAEGDPFFYGSFMHIWRRLECRTEVEVVPGVTGMSGCWSRSGAPITWGDDILTVLPGTLDEPRLIARLRDTDAAVIMKLGRNLPKVRRAVEAAGRIDGAIYVERGTMTAERIMPLTECHEGRGPYFSLILIPGNGRRL
jgi:precorrin-2/cobalt-factor-2 C20-methyltransferase